MSIARGNSKILSRILLLGLRDVCATVLAIVHAAGRLPLWFLRELSYSFDCVTNGKKVDEANCLLLNDFDSVNWTEFAEVFTKFVLGHVLRQAAQVDITRSARLLDRKRNRCRHLR